ncbi:MAG: methyltransferase domain-containing protein [Croceibacterium sp.]
MRLSLPLALAFCLCACNAADEGRAATARAFPQADRPVSGRGGSGFSTEAARDDRNEAMTVMDLALIRPGMTVADIGAGEGYYTVRLAERVDGKGRVLAEDIDRDAMGRLANRIERDHLDNAYAQVGTADDPRLPDNSFDRIFMVHMYHEIEEPYAFLWRLRPALRAGGQVIVVDVDKPTDRHGIAPQLLFCEFAAVGFKLAEFVRKPELAGYYAQFTVEGARPEPDKIKPCSQAVIQQQAVPAGAGKVG